MIVPAHKATRLCKTCGNATAERWCKYYVDAVTGEYVGLETARTECKGDQWESAVWHHVDTVPKVRTDTIETPMATIHKDPWDKINKTYE